MEAQPNFTPQSYSPEHHIKIHAWTSLVIAASLIAANGYLYFLRSSYLDQGARTAQENEQKMQELVAQRSNMSDWQTYRNEEYGFEFQYPKDWKLFLNSDSI